MIVNNIEEVECFEEILRILCNLTNQIIQSNKINSTEYKQKIFAVASFLEFIKAGADVNVEIQKDNKKAFIIDLR